MAERLGYWIKLYEKMLESNTMGKLPDHLWRRAVELFLLAGKNGGGGTLPPIEDMAWKLRVTDARLSENLELLARVGIVHEEGGCWNVTNFGRYQGEGISPTERSRKFREKKRFSNVAITECNVLEENREEKNRKEEDKEKDRREDIKTSAASNYIYSTYSTLEGILMGVTGFGIPPGKRDAILDSMQQLNFVGKATKDYLKTFYVEWVKRGYNKTNFSWLTDWAIVGEIPKKKWVKKENVREGVKCKPYDEGICEIIPRYMESGLPLEECVHCPRYAEQ